MPALALIAAVGRNGAIGRAGRVPWDYPEDRAHFARVTHGHAVVMGRRTWEETRGPLPDRQNIVISRTLGEVEGARLARDLTEALQLAWSLDEEPFVIGGTRLFEESMPRVTRALITWIPEAPEADAFFHFDAAGFHLMGEQAGARGERYSEYERIWLPSA